MTRNKLLWKTELSYWLREEDEDKLQALWNRADAVRREFVGDAVHLRGIIEISNYCLRRCTYCGINYDNRKISRYRMSRQEIMDCVREIAGYNYGTVVLQAGEDPRIEALWIANLIKEIKNETGLAVTLSLGERKAQELELWKQAGADRYLLKIETGNPTLYDHIHPTALKSPWTTRMEILRFLKESGYETGSGIMIGIPGQTYDDVLHDIFLFKEMGIQMLGIGPYLPHPDTALSAELNEFSGYDNQVPNTELMTYKVNALARIICPNVNIPTTTALATVNRSTGRELGLQRGANVIMPNFTPLKYRRCYEIYPGRVCLEEFGAGVQEMIHKRIISIGRKIGRGPGSALNNAFNGKTCGTERRVV